MLFRAGRHWRTLKVLCQPHSTCYTFSMTNASAPAVGSPVALRSIPSQPIGRIVEIQAIRPEDGLFRFILDTQQAGGPVVLLSTHAVVLKG